MIYRVHCALSLIILFYISACCDTRYFKNVCLFLFVEVKALLGLCYMLYNIRGKIKFLCLTISTYSMDSDLARQNIGPDLGQNCLTLGCIPEMIQVKKKFEGKKKEKYFLACRVTMMVRGIKVRRHMMNIFVFQVSNKMLVSRAGNHKMAVRKPNCEDPIRLHFQKQTNLGLHCSSRPFGRQLVFDYFRKSTISSYRVHTGKFE